MAIVSTGVERGETVFIESELGGFVDLGQGPRRRGAAEEAKDMSGTAVQRVEIDRLALVHNIREFRRLIGPRRKFLAVVKANAYGHGILEVAGIAVAEGVDWLGVNSVDEGAALRRAGIDAPILVLGYAPLASLEEAVGRGPPADRLQPGDRRAAGRPGRPASGKTVRVHVKLETGTWRQGVAAKDLAAFVRDIRQRPGLVVEGLSSHFANIEDTTKHDYPRRQLEIYRSACRELEAGGPRVPLKHMSCTASTILFPEPGFNLARVGIGLYGLVAVQGDLPVLPARQEGTRCRSSRSSPGRPGSPRSRASRPGPTSATAAPTGRPGRPSSPSSPSAISTATTAASPTRPTSWSRAGGRRCGAGWPWTSSWPTSPTFPARGSRTR